MKINAIFIKEQFKNIAYMYNMNWIVEDEYQLILENKDIKIDFGTEKWEDGIILYITNKARNEFYYPDDLELKKGFSDYEAYLNVSEKNTLQGLDENNSKIIFSFRILLERYCQDVLRGDFSLVGEGTSL